MLKPAYDPGLTQKYTGTLRRAINKNGRFNVRRTGGTWRDFHPYLFLVNASWPTFLSIVIGVFMAVNLLFAGVYWWVGIEHLHGADAGTPGMRFLNAFFFSTHTLSTVGYGSIWPQGIGANVVAATESLIGVMTFALITGILFGRFSRPSARIGYSQRMVMAPYCDGTSLQFRVVNRRTNNLINLDARVLLMTVERVGGSLQRKYANLELERDSVIFFPLTWTVVHPITTASPLYGKTAVDLEALQAEILIMIRAIDETFSQTVHSRYSYRYDEIEWGAKFAPAFDVETSGDLRLEVNRVSDIETAVARVEASLEASAEKVK
jgi:inward rectifier potassium channel